MGQVTTPTPIPAAAHRPPPYYEDGAGRVLYCARWEDTLPSFADGSFDLIFTSPPYNLGTTSGGGFPGATKLGHYAAGAGMAQRGGMGKWSGGKLADGYDEHDDAMPYPEYEAWQKAFLLECWRLIPDTGAIYYQHKPRVQYGVLWTPLALNPGLPVRQIVIWARAGGINFAPTHYVPTHEWIVIFAKPGFRLKSKGASGVGDVWYVPQELNNPHPAAFPLALPLRAIETTGAKRVLDPHCGSGTVLRAAKDSGVEAVGVDRSERYCRMSVDRLRQEVLFANTPAAAQEVA